MVHYPARLSAKWHLQVRQEHSVFYPECIDSSVVVEPESGEKRGRYGIKWKKLSEFIRLPFDFRSEQRFLPPLLEGERFSRRCRTVWRALPGGSPFPQIGISSREYLCRGARKSV